MKWFFFLLLLANIGLLIWIYPQFSEPEIVAGPTADIKALTLLSEVTRDADVLPEKTESVSASEVTGVSDALQKKTEDVSSSEITGDSNVGQKKTEINSTNEESEALMAEQLRAQNESNQNNPVTEQAPESPLEKLKPEAAIEKQIQALMLSEQEEEVGGNTTEQMLDLQCNTVGPLVNRADVEKLSLRLRATGLQPSLNSESTNEQEGYWVLVPPQKTRGKAVATVKRLQAAGITDFWRFTSGKLVHAISLGLFRDEARAEIRRQSIAVKGFNVEVRPRYRQKINYWLGFSFTGEPPITEAKWAETVEIYPGIEQRSVDCLEIATE